MPGVGGSSSLPTTIYQDECVIAWYVGISHSILGEGSFILQEIDAPVLSNMLSWAVFPSLMLWVEPRALYTLSKCFTAELNIQPF